MELGKILHTDFDSLPYPVFENEREALSRYKKQAISKERQFLDRKRRQEKELVMYVSNRLKEWGSSKLQYSEVKRLIPCQSQSCQRHETAKFFSGIPVRSPPKKVCSDIYLGEEHAYGNTEKHSSKDPIHCSIRVCKPMSTLSTNASTHQKRPTVDKVYRVTAIAKGFLTRRLLNSEKVKAIITTIKDAERVLLSLDNPVTMQDFDLQQRVINQLQTAKLKLHSIFFDVSDKERMLYIAHSRKLLRERQFKSTEFQPQGTRLSSATVKTIERKKRLSSLPVPTNSRSVTTVKGKSLRSVDRTLKQQIPAKSQRDEKKQTPSSVSIKAARSDTRTSSSVKRQTPPEKSSYGPKTISGTAGNKLERKSQLSRGYSLRKAGTVKVQVGTKLQRHSSLKHKQT